MVGYAPGTAPGECAEEDTVIYIDQPNVTLSWDEGLRAVVIVWRGFNEGEGFRKPMERGLQILQEKKASRWLADLRESKVITPEDQAWLVNDWRPGGPAASGLYTAFVPPKSTVALMGVKRVQSKAQTVVGKNISYFETVEQARAWLATRPG